MSGEPDLNKNNQLASWHRQIVSVIFRHGYIKVTGTPLFIGLFFAIYFYLLKAPAYPTTVMPFTVLDRLITFQPRAMPLYISLWIYVSLPPALLATRRELYKYGVAMAATCAAGLSIFYFWPTAVPVTDIVWAQHPAVGFLKGLDTSGNACPSLHVATAIFSGVWLHHLLRRFGVPLWVLVFNWAWCLGIIYSTLATRQHVVVDVLAGLALGVLSAYLSLRQRRQAEVHVKLHQQSI